MRYSLIVCATLILSAIVSPQGRQFEPTGRDRFAIGRHTFFDFGPPNDYYELLVVGPTARGASIERITLTPTVDVCLRPPQIEMATASIATSPSTLLGKTNPCTIPEKELQTELKRCKNCGVFSGANVAMQVQCGAQTRIVRSAILDKDMFDPTPNTPKHTSWTMQLLARLDEALGPEVMQKSIFPVFEEYKASMQDDASQTFRDLSLGKYDGLFQGAPDKPSDLYRASRVPPAVPSVSLQSSTPFQPSISFMPEYPPIGKAAHIQGPVSFKIEVDENGGVKDIAFDSGSPLLYGVVKDAVTRWRFSEAAFNNEVSATINFALNCLPRRASH